jgi:hypothetical protein
VHCALCCCSCLAACLIHQQCGPAAVLCWAMLQASLHHRVLLWHNQKLQLPRALLESTKDLRRRRPAAQVLAWGAPQLPMLSCRRLCWHGEIVACRASTHRGGSWWMLLCFLCLWPQCQGCMAQLRVLQHWWLRASIDTTGRMEVFTVCFGCCCCLMDGAGGLDCLVAVMPPCLRGSTVDCDSLQRDDYTTYIEPQLRFQFPWTCKFTGSQFRLAKKFLPQISITHTQHHPPSSPFRITPTASA